MSVRILIGDVRERLRELPDESVHCVVTSPPYWGLRDYGVPGQLGLEATPEEHVRVMVDVFREVRRVMRRDATLWMNYGDVYAHSGACGGESPVGKNKARATDRAKQLQMKYAIPAGLKPKDLVGMPWRLALALQADGWYLRSDIIWAKPNPMPESVTDRPTKSHEHLFLLAKAERYYYDADAVLEKVAAGTVERSRYSHQYATRAHRNGGTPQSGGIRPDAIEEPPAGRNLRDVWTIPTEPFPGAHYATFPQALVVPCIKAGTSEHGCCSTCGAPWVREREEDTGGAKGKGWCDHGRDLTRGNAKTASSNGYRRGATTGWSPGCDCGAPVVPCTVLDPFGGSGTVGLVADKLGRHAVLIELKPDGIAERRIRGDCPLFAQVEAC